MEDYLKNKNTGDLTDDVALEIFESLGGPDASMSERVSAAEQLISDQKIDLEKLSNKLQELTNDCSEKEDHIKQQKQKIKEVHMFLKHLVERESALDLEAEALKEEISKLEGNTKE